jgi:uncharacterized protein (TIGR02594 family)
MNNTEDLVKIASSQMGVREIRGSRHNATILKYADEVGLGWINDDETPWCSIFMNWVAKEGGYERTGKANARSWLDIGNEIDYEDAEAGDVVIYWRVRKDSAFGHVGIFLGYSHDRTKIFTLGGNQGDEVSIEDYATSRLLGIRRLDQIQAFRPKAGLMKRGSTGKNVKALQRALNRLGFEVGAVDGDYGPKTEKAVKALQESSNGQLSVDGVFGAKTRAFLLEQLDAN